MKRALQTILVFGAASSAAGFLRPVGKRACALRKVCAPVPVPLLPLALLKKAGQAKRAQQAAICRSAKQAKQAKRAAKLATAALAPLAPVAAFYGVMGAPVYGKGLGLGTGGMVDFETLEKRVTTNEYLAAPSGLCGRFEVGGGNRGGGGGAAVGPPPPTYDVSADELTKIFLDMVSDLYTLKQYALPTLSRQDEKRYVFVQRTPLLRFPDVINVQFLPRESSSSEDGAGAASTLAIHSGSVYGADDLGKNRERVVEWLARLDDAVVAFNDAKQQQQQQQKKEEEGTTEEAAATGLEGKAATAEPAAEKEAEAEVPNDQEEKGEGVLVAEETEKKEGRADAEEGAVEGEATAVVTEEAVEGTAVAAAAVKEEEAKGEAAETDSDGDGVVVGVEEEEEEEEEKKEAEEEK